MYNKTWMLVKQNSINDVKFTIATRIERENVFALEHFPDNDTIYVDADDTIATFEADIEKSIEELSNIDKTQYETLLSKPASEYKDFCNKAKDIMELCKDGKFKVMVKYIDADSGREVETLENKRVLNYLKSTITTRETV